VASVTVHKDMLPHTHTHTHTHTHRHTPWQTQSNISGTVLRSSAGSKTCTAVKL